VWLLISRRTLGEISLTIRGHPHAHHVIVLNERQLKRLLNAYILYYHDDRTHLAFAKGTPAGREPEKNPNIGCPVVSMPRLGGLHHRYGLAA
jgi:hypothetical protein